jgi:hypothetical protein
MSAPPTLSAAEFARFLRHSPQHDSKASAPASSASGAATNSQATAASAGLPPRVVLERSTPVLVPLSMSNGSWSKFVLNALHKQPVTMAGVVSADSKTAAGALPSLPFQTSWSQVAESKSTTKQRVLDPAVLHAPANRALYDTIRLTLPISSEIALLKARGRSHVNPYVTRAVACTATATSAVAQSDKKLGSSPATDKLSLILDGVLTEPSNFTLHVDSPASFWPLTVAGTLSPAFLILELTCLFVGLMRVQHMIPVWQCCPAIKWCY